MSKLMLADDTLEAARRVAEWWVVWRAAFDPATMQEERLLPELREALELTNRLGEPGDPHYPGLRHAGKLRDRDVVRLRGAATQMEEILRDYLADARVGRSTGKRRNWAVARTAWADGRLVDPLTVLAAIGRETAVA